MKNFVYLHRQTHMNMARINADNGHTLSGLVGPIVISQRRSGTVISRRAEQKKCTTAAAGRNRFKMSNISTTYNILKPCKYAAQSEGKHTPQQRRGFFIGSNLGLTPAWLTKQESAHNLCVLMPYQVTRGVLPSITVELYDDYFATSILVNPDHQQAPQTVGELTARILQCNEEYSDGDIIAIEMLRKHNGDDVFAFEYILKLDSGSNRPITDFWPSGLVDLSGWYLTIPHNNEPVACTVVHVREGKTPRYSTQFFEVANYDNMQWVGDEAFARAAQSYGYQTQ